jgi:hypothetical protein
MPQMLHFPVFEVWVLTFFMLILGAFHHKLSTIQMRIWLTSHNCNRKSNTPSHTSFRCWILLEICPSNTFRYVLDQ